jgi:hypothetical protein
MHIKTILFGLLLGSTAAQAQSLIQQIVYPQGGFIAGKYGVEASYNISALPFGSFGANQVRIGGKFDNISLGIGLHERQQTDFVDTKGKLSSFSIDLGYDLALGKQYGLSIMALQTFADSPTFAENSTNTTLKENVTALSLLFYKRVNFGNFYLKPCIGLELPSITQTVRRNEEIQNSAPVIVENKFSIFLPQAYVGLGFGLKINDISIQALPLLCNATAQRYFGFSLGAAYNFKTETAFKGKTQ